MKHEIVKRYQADQVTAEPKAMFLLRNKDNGKFICFESRMTLPGLKINPYTWTFKNIKLFICGKKTIKAFNTFDEADTYRKNFEAGLPADEVVESAKNKKK